MIMFLRAAFGLLDRGARLRFMWFAVVSIVVAGLEAVAVALIVPLTELLVATSDDDLPSVVDRIDRYVNVTTREGAAFVLGVLVVLVFTVKAAVALVNVRWAIGNSLRQEALLARRLFAQYLLAPATFHLERSSSEIQRTLNHALPLVFRRTLPFAMSAAADAVTLLGVVVVILVNDASVAIPAVAYFMVVGFLYQRFIAGRQRVAARDAHLEVADRFQDVQEAVRATKEISVLHRQGYFIERFYRTKLDLVRAQRVLIFYQLMPRYYLDLAFIGGAMMIAGIAVATRGEEQAMVTVGLFLAAGFRLVVPLNRVMSTFTLARSAMPSVNQVKDDIAELQVLSASRSDTSEGRLGRVALELDDVRFRYDTATADTLDGISLRIEPGDDVGIVGTTGAGKTTLLNVLLGLLDPQSGRITVGDRPLDTCRTDWQLSIGYVPQETFLLDDSIRANVAFGLEPSEIDDERVREVLRVAQIEDVVDDLPNGLDSTVGEAGVRLSGGQRQRIGLARALYHRPEVLVLDEATSALDTETESRVMANIEAMVGDLTIITVSHRLSTLQRCDRIYFLNDGRIASMGTFAELKKQEPEFAQLVSLAQLAGST